MMGKAPTRAAAAPLPRFLPTITVMKHSTLLKRTGKHDENFATMAHDTKMIDDDLPREASQMLMLDLEISERNHKAHRVVVVSSPYRSCLQTATIVAQEFGLSSIQVHHGLGEAVKTSRDLGWDFAYEQLTLSDFEMDEVVREKSAEGELQREAFPVHIAAVLGHSLGVDDVQESDVLYKHRVGEVLDDVAAALERDGDHFVIIGHSSTLQVFSRHFITDKSCAIIVGSDQDCSFLTLATPSPSSFFCTGRSRLQLRPVRADDPSKKIGFQDTGFGAGLCFSST